MYMAYLIYGYVICHREGHIAKRPVCKFHSRENYASYNDEFTFYRVLSYVESIGTNFAVPTFVVSWLGAI